MTQLLSNTDKHTAVVFRLIATTTILLLGGIFVFLSETGMRAFTAIPLFDFLFGREWNPTAYTDVSWGILPLIASSLFVSGTAVFVAVPFGFSIAIYLSELAPPRLREVVKPLIEMIASIPTVALGFLGIVVLAPITAGVFQIPSGLTGLTAAILVAIVSVPTIASLAEDALGSVSKRYREASLALGASHWTTIRRIVIPAARSGLIGAVMLGFGRAVGETVIVLMVGGNSRIFPTTLLDAVRPMTATIAIEIKETVVGSLHWQALFAIGLVLFIVTFFLNIVAELVFARGRHE